MDSCGAFSRERAVKRSIVVKYCLIALATLLAIACGLWLLGWRPNFDRSIELSDIFGSVENGSAYDRATVDLGNVKKVVLPDDVVLRRVGDPGQLTVFMKKRMSFHGWPPESMSIRDERKNMGCAVKRDGADLLVATFGEWDSHIEGGTKITVLACVPEGVEVEQRKGLSVRRALDRNGTGSI
jgi:hypothetical protein